MTAATIDVGLIGYGMAGQQFHAPFISVVPRLRLAAVATSRTGPFPELGEARIVADPRAIIDDPALDLVVIASPNRTHFVLAEAALNAGKHVVVEKPFMVGLDEADAVIALAAQRKRLLSVFHNRRWDGDFRTIQRLIASGRLGEISHCAMCWDRFRPEAKRSWRDDPGPGAGLLADLGPHLVDQALVLFGPPEAIKADLAIQRDGGEVDDCFELQLHYGAMRVLLGASMMMPEPRPRFMLRGRAGSFIKHGLDPQVVQLVREGLDPADPRFGEETEEAFGSLTSADGSIERIATERGHYGEFYEGVAAAILDGAPPPVDPADARLGLVIIELARSSAVEGVRLPIRS